jgi:hypothetical protein
MGGAEGPCVADRTDATRPIAGVTRLTVRNIRGLLTKHAQEVVRNLGPASPAPEAASEAQPMSFRDFTQFMCRFLSMN